tara:strand:- start:4204 stop:4677 length:474 start_codon:yes stop_codon:yes gene_type:complete
MRNFEQHPLYRKILKEETKRARRLIFEYNEEQIWNGMSDIEKEDALLSADDDMGPDFADEYVDEDWLDIPDVIKNRIDLKSLAKRSKIGTYKVSYVYKDNNGEKSNIFDEETEITQDDINKSIDKEATSLHNLLKYKIENDMGGTIRVMKFDSIIKL